MKDVAMTWNGGEGEGVAGGIAAVLCICTSSQRAASSWLELALSIARPVEVQQGMHATRLRQGAQGS